MIDQQVAMQNDMPVSGQARGFNAGRMVIAAVIAVAIHRAGGNARPVIVAAVQLRLDKPRINTASSFIRAAPRLV